MPPPVLPTYYYLDHFTEMLSFVRGTYSSILADEHHAFIARFEGLSKDAQCLLIRMINRRGSEPPRVCRRLFGLSHAAMAGCSIMA